MKPRIALKSTLKSIALARIIHESGVTREFWSER
jgi:hypothetical protein